MTLAIVDLATLGELVVVSLVAGVGVTVLYAFAVALITRSAEVGREGRTGGAVARGAGATVCALVVVAAVAAGLVGIAG